MSQVAIRPPYLDPALPDMLARLPAPRHALFLDRDGVINVNHGYVHTPEQTEWVPGIFELVVKAGANGYLPVVVTNQAGIGRGYYDEARFLEYTAWMHGQFSARGAPLAATYWCPHHPDGGGGEYRTTCPCRKPAPGMIERAVGELELTLAGSVLVGDSATDMQAASAAGIHRRILLGSHSDAQAVRYVSDLSEMIEDFEFESHD